MGPNAKRHRTNTEIPNVITVQIMRPRPPPGPTAPRPIERPAPSSLAASAFIDVLLKTSSTAVNARSVFLIECAADVHGGQDSEDEGLDHGHEDLEHVDEHRGAL